MPPKKSKTEQYKPEEAEKIILSYLKDQYRPYAQADIILNLHGKINKTTMTKCLNDLVESGKILCKSFGKFNCYFCKPMDVTDNGQKLSSLQGSNNVDLDTDLSGYEEDLKRLQTQNITLQKEFDTMSTTPKNDELIERFLKLKMQFKSIEQVISESENSLDKSGYDSKNENEMKKLKKDLRIILSKFKKRKQLFNNIKLTIQDNLENSKTIFDDIGSSFEYMKLSDSLFTELTRFCEEP